MRIRVVATCGSVIVWLAGAAVSAATLGDLQLRSYFDQPLDASVALYDIATEDPVTVRLGSQAAFERVGIEPGSLSFTLKFTVVREAAGVARIEITSPEPIREPVLGFVIEAAVDGATVVREYAALMDPAPIGGGPASVAAGAPASIAAGVPAAPVPTAVEAGPGSPAPPAVAIGSGAPTRESADGRGATARRQEVAPRREQRPGARPDARAEYGPVRPGQTLWRIAAEARPDAGIGIVQMMISLQRANPTAFVGGNMNNLRVGALLEIPTRAEIGRSGLAESQRSFERQVERWRQIGPTAADPEPAVVVATPEPPAAVAPARDEVAVAGPAAPVREASVSLAAAGETEGFEARLARERGVRDQLDAENRDIRARLDRLNERIASVVKLLGKHGAELDELKARFGVAAPAAGLPRPALARAAAPAAPSESAPTTASESAPVAPPTGTATPAPRTVAPPASRFPTVPLPSTTPKPGVVESVLGVIRDSRSAVATVAFALLILALLAWVVIQRVGYKARRALEARQEAKEDEVLKADMRQKAEKAVQLQTAGAALLESRRHERLARDGAATRPGPGGSRPDAIGSLYQEVDVYMAYGRADDAVRLLQKAISEAPERADVKAKLAQVYFQVKDRQGFLDVTRSLHQTIQFPGDRDLWDEVSEMGRQIAPQDVLFGGGEEGASEPTERSIQPPPVDQLAARRNRKKNP